MDTQTLEKILKNIRSEIKHYIVKGNLKALVIGESGGIDSAICTVLAAPVCKDLGIKLIGRSITIETNKPDEIARGEAIGTNFCTDFKAINLTNEYKTMFGALEYEVDTEDNLLFKLRKGNLKARMRMIYLFDLAQKHGGMVLSTDNYTELMLGFWTLHGDVGDYGMIQNLWKTEVYQLAKYLVETELKNPAQKQALQQCIDAVPTDGLGITNSDLDQLGASNYDEVDKILKEYLADDSKNIQHPVVQRHIKSAYKRANPYNIPIEDLFK
jgi:NAD+ synthase